MSELILTVEYSTGQEEIYEGLTERELERVEEAKIEELIEEGWQWDGVGQWWYRGEETVEIILREG